MLSNSNKRLQGVNERQDLELHLATTITDIPCDGQRHYGSIISSGLTRPQEWGNRVRVCGVRCSAVDSDGFVQALGTACINLELFSQRVGNDSEYSRDKVCIAFQDFNGIAASTDHDEIDTRGNFNDILVNNDGEEIVHYAISVTGTASGVTSTNVALSLRGNAVW